MHVEPQKYMVYGCISRLGPTSLEITELPIRSWTQSYKESVLEPMLTGNEKSPPFIRYEYIQSFNLPYHHKGTTVDIINNVYYINSDYKEYHTDTTVKFVVTLSEQKMKEAEEIGFHKKFKLESSLSTGNMVREVISLLSHICTCYLYKLP